MPATLRRAVFVGIAALSLSCPAHALFRAYLSSGGNDSNPCTIQQPCRLLPAALAAVDDGGDIWMLDSANYNTGTVTIAKSVTILAVPGVLGSVVGNGGDAIYVDAPGKEVTLRNLLIRKLSGNVSGIVLANASIVSIDGCVVTGFSSPYPGGYGIFVGGALTFTVSNSTFRNNGSSAINVSGAARGSITGTKIVGPGYVGIWAAPAATSTAIRMAIVDCEVSGYSYAYSILSGTNVIMTVDRSVALNNYAGFWQQGSAGSLMSVSNSVASGNDYGFMNYGYGGVFESLRNNHYAGNTYAASSNITTGTPQ